MSKKGDSALDKHIKHEKRFSYLLLTGLILIFLLLWWGAWSMMGRLGSVSKTTHVDEGGITIQQSGIGTSNLKDNSITMQKVDPIIRSMLQKQANAQTVQNIVNNSYTTNQFTTNTTNQTVNQPETREASGDIVGNFDKGFTIAEDAVSLTGDTTGDYVKSLSVGDGLTGGASGEGSVGSVIVNLANGSGLSFVNGALSITNNCANNQLLKWNQSTSAWVCGADLTGGGGSLTVREGDGSPSANPVAELQFGPSNVSNDEFIVTDQGGNVARVTLGDKVALTSKNATITANWAFNNAVLANGGISINGDTITDLTGTGLTNTGGELSTTLGASIGSTEIENGAVTNNAIANSTITLSKLNQNGCTSGQVIKMSGSSWSCGTDIDTDTNTTYSAGSGLSLTGTTFALDTANPNTWTANQTFDGGVTLDGDTITDLTGTGLAASGGSLYATLGTSIDSGEIVDGTITGNDVSNASLSLSKLAQSGCTSGQVAKWNGSAWACASDIDTDTDTNTTYSAGPGLALNSTTFSLDTANPNTWIANQTFNGGLTIDNETFTDLTGSGLMSAAGVLSAVLGNSIDSAEIIDGTVSTSDLANGGVTFGKINQNGCSTGQIIKWNGSAWACGADIDTDTDTNTTYSAGSGLSLTGTTFSLNTANANTWTANQTFNGGISMAGDTVTDLTGTGLAVTGGALYATLGTSIDSSEIVDGTIAAADVADAALTLAKLNQSGCSTGQIVKWNGTAWGCGTDIDTNTTYTAGSGLSLSGTTFSLDGNLAIFKTIATSAGSSPVADSLTDTLSLNSGNGITVTGNATTDTITLDVNLASGGGLMVNGSALSLLNTCANQQYLAWNSGTSSWVCTSSPSAPNNFLTFAADSGNAVADSTSDTITIVGGNGLSSIATDSPDTVTLNIDLAAGSGLSFNGGLLSLKPCSEGQILKYTSSAWNCATDSLPATAYKQQLEGSDNRAVGMTLTPLLTNGSGTPQSLPITIVPGNKVGFFATVEVSSTVATGPVTYVVIRDDNGDGDCVTGGGDGTQVGGQVSSFISSVAQGFTTTFSFSDISPIATTSNYQICASTTIATGTTTSTDRSLRLEESL